MTSSVDPRTETATILAVLKTLGVAEMGFPAGYKFDLDSFGNKPPYRDFEPGSVIPSASGRGIGVGEQAQPYNWAFQIHHVAPTREEALNLSIESDMVLIGWAPSIASTPISTFFFNMYDETVKGGEKVQWIATRFYETTLGQNPDL